jgi:hypothetical protein
VHRAAIFVTIGDDDGDLWKKNLKEAKDGGGVPECVSVSCSWQAGTFVPGHAVELTICML